jgi:uncharacterized membrane protein affecting hemolysin expression
LEAIEDEKRKQRIAAIMAEETERVRREQSLVTGVADKDEKVDVLIDHPTQDRMIIDGAIYQVGHTYSMPRHQADSINAMMWAARLHEQSLDGSTRTDFYRKQKPILVGKTGVETAPASEMVRVG